MDKLNKRTYETKTFPCHYSPQNQNEKILQNYYKMGEKNTLSKITFLVFYYYYFLILWGFLFVENKYISILLEIKKYIYNNNLNFKIFIDYGKYCCTVFIYVD